MWWFRKDKPKKHSEIVRELIEERKKMTRDELFQKNDKEESEYRKIIRSLTCNPAATVYTSLQSVALRLEDEGFLVGFNNYMWYVEVPKE